MHAVKFDTVAEFAGGTQKKPYTWNWGHEKKD